MGLVFVDTSAWWAFFDRSDQWHDEADRTMRHLVHKGSSLVTTDDVFDEVVTGLLGRAGHRAAVKAGCVILASGTVTLVVIDNTLFEEAWEIFQRYDKMRWSLTDCTSMALMRKQAIRVAFSFDHDFVKMGFEVLPH